MPLIMWYNQHKRDIEFVSIIVAVLLVLLQAYLGAREDITRQIYQIESWKNEEHKNNEIMRDLIANETWYEGRPSHFRFVIGNLETLEKEGRISRKEVRDIFVIRLFEYLQAQEWLDAGNSPALLIFSNLTQKGIENRGSYVKQAIASMRWLNDTRLDHENSVEIYKECLEPFYIISFKQCSSKNEVDQTKSSIGGNLFNATWLNQNVNTRKP